MNKFLSKLFLVAAVALVIPAFTSCDDDKKDEPTVSASEIIGDYNGSISMLGSEVVPTATISLAAKEGVSNKVVVSMNQIIPVGEQGALMGLPEYLPLNVACDANAAAGSGKCQITANSSVDFGVDLYREVPITINGNIDSKKHAVINITVTIGVISLPVVFTGDCK